MTPTRKIIALWIAAICLFTLLFSALPSVAEGAVRSEILAEKVVFSQLTADDRFVIVCEPGKVSASLDAVNSQIDTVKVTPAHTASRQVLTAMDPNIAVFAFEYDDSGDVYLKCESGYLTCSDDGRSLYYAQTPEPCSLWRIDDDGFLYNPNSLWTYRESSTANVYLEYFAGNQHFSTFPRYEGVDESEMIFAFYRLSDSAPGEAVIEDRHYRLPVFETSDVHGYLVELSDGDPLYLLAYIADKVDDVRGHGDDARKDLAILLDGGDIYQGSTLSNILKGQSVSAAFDMMGYDAVTVGNHEFDWQLDSMVDPDGTMPDYDVNGYAGENKIPVIVCNLYRNGEKCSLAGDYVILEKTARNNAGQELPVKVGVIGLAGLYGNSIRRDLFADQGYSIKEDYDLVNALAESLEASGQCDATILLAHESPTTIVKSIGEDTPIDLVLGGHAHRIENWTTSFGLAYLEPSCYSRAYAYADLAFEEVDGAPSFAGVENSHIFMTNTDREKLEKTPENADELAENVLELSDALKDSAMEILQSEIGVITQSIERYVYLPESGKRSTSGGNWLSSIYARAVNADVAFINGSGLRTDLTVDPDRGSRTITLYDIYQAFPFDNRIFCYELTYEELLTALEYSMTGGGSILFTYMTGIDCYFTEEGINAIVTADGEAIYVNGVWKEGWKDRHLRVALSEYMATTNRNKGHMSNPFVEWTDTPRLVDRDEIDSESAIRVLVREAAANDDHLSVDTQPHFINKIYAPQSGD